MITPSDGGPADKAGIESKDVLISINGKTTKGLSLYDAGDLLQGAEGSEVILHTAFASALAWSVSSLIRHMPPR